MMLLINLVGFIFSADFTDTLSSKMSDISGKPLQKPTEL